MNSKLDNSFLKINIKKSLKNFILVRLTLPAQEAIAGQAISVALGQYGVKSQEFIKEFNLKTSSFIKGLEITTYVKVYKDGSFNLEIKGPKIAHILKIFMESENYKTLSVNDIISHFVPIVFKLRPDLRNSSMISISKSVLSTLKGKN